MTNSIAANIAKDLFQDRVAVLATMHRKEEAIAPILEAELGIQITVPPNFNTDRFGTFTREIARSGDQLEAARLKAKEALLQTGGTLAIASEGTFAPHPTIPYLPCNRELVLLIDLDHQLEIIGQALSLETNFNHKLVDSVEAAFLFARKIGFPNHGLVVMTDPGATSSPHIVKGITQDDQLKEAVLQAIAHSSTGKANLETDMRALYNPTRMKVIAQATRDLVQTIQQVCPNCHTPGFKLTERKSGLPCQWCHSPTELTRSAIYSCPKCGFSQEKLFPDGIEFADPGQCSYCNP